MQDFSIVDKCISIVAKRCAGKSYLLKWIVDLERDKFHKIIVICPTEGINKFYQKNNFVKKGNVHEEFKEDFIEALLEKMTETNTDKPQSERKRVLLILDDIVADTALDQSKIITKLFVRARHVNITLIVTTQYLKLISPVMRNNSDYIICGQMNSQGVKILIDEYNSVLSPKEFTKMFIENTRDYNFLCINNNSVKDNKDLDELYFTIKVPNSFYEKNKI